VEQLAAAAAEATAWLKTVHGITVPAVRVTRTQSDQGRPGFISHGERDPGRRTDPGATFPWDAFLDHFRTLTQEDDMSQYAEQLDKLIKQGEAAKRRDIAQRKIIKAQGQILSDIADTVTGTTEDLDDVKERIAKTKRELLNAIHELDESTES
jgi:hypothetical protein